VDAIVQAGAHLLVSRGWGAATTNHIAERAGVSVGSLYKYFPNKASILAEVARRRIDGEVEATLATLAGGPAALERLVSDMLERYERNAALDTQLLEQVGTMEVARALRAAEAQVVRSTARTLGVSREVAFVSVHALRGTLIAAAAQAPEMLRSPAFRGELLRMLRALLG
jgi:AcrR family transcriptional regulator